jgi:hypothetical protein
MADRPAGREGKGEMIGRGAGRTIRDRGWAAGVALLLAAGLTLVPPAVAPASAATGRLLVSSAATYTVDPVAGVVHVSDSVTLRNDKPSSATYFYYWRDLSWNVHPQSTSIAVRDSSGPLKVTPRTRDGYIEAEFRLRRNLLYRQSVTLTITWDLPGGAPRSESRIRVGEAFATFDLWAWGDSGQSSVTVKLPPGFEPVTYGADLEPTTTSGGVTLSAAAIARPNDFWAAVVAVRDRSMASDELALPAGIEVVVRGWPEDAIWRTTVSKTLRTGLPELLELIGLPWPVEDELEVTEVYSPTLEGYAGIYYPDEQRIEISEELDTLTIIHEAAHAWFNGDLFADRWVGEGLANTYAAAVLVELGEEEQLPDRPRSGDAGEVDLETWLFPGRVDDETSARETYGYNASWYVVHEIFVEIEADGLRAVLAAAEADQIAYRGAGVPEHVPSTNNWRRFLDLLEEVGGSERAEELFRDLVTTSAQDRMLDDRAVARAAYADLVEAGDGWLPPLYIRSLMGTWAFAKVGARIDEATEVLELRDEIAAAAAALDLAPSDAVETAYEVAENGFLKAERAAEAELDALAILAEADAAIAAEPDFVSTIGLIGQAPAVSYTAAETAYEAGELAAAEVAAADAQAIIEAAPGIGRERLAIGGGISAGAVLLLLAAILLVRRRRRRKAALLAAAAATAAPVVDGPVVDGPVEPFATEPVSPPPAFASGPYGTLAADSPAPPPDADRAGDPDGGTADGEGSSATP